MSFFDDIENDIISSDIISYNESYKNMYGVSSIDDIKTLHDFILYILEVSQIFQVLNELKKFIEFCNNSIYSKTLRYFFSEIDPFKQRYTDIDYYICETTNDYIIRQNLPNKKFIQLICYFDYIDNNIRVIISLCRFNRPNKSICSQEFNINDFISVTNMNAYKQNFIEDISNTLDNEDYLTFFNDNYC